MGDWVSRARNHTPVIGNVQDFGAEFWAWWIDINPAWRGDMRPLSRTAADMSWASMDYKGQNGFLNVLMVLKWWRDAIDIPSPDWEEAVAEVTWVLQQMKK